jgi:hypothetical protein
VETTTGSPITATGTIRGSELVNAQVGTTYTYLTGDRAKLVTHSNAAAIAGTLPQAGASFPSGWYLDVQNRGAGTLTITPTVSTVDGAASLVLTTNQGARVVSDGTNYFTQRGIGAATGAPTDATYITQTAHAGLSAEQAMGALATGIVKNTTTSGVQSIAVSGTDYAAPPVGAANAIQGTNGSGVHTDTGCTGTGGAMTCQSFEATGAGPGVLTMLEGTVVAAGATAGKHNIGIDSADSLPKSRENAGALVTYFSTANLPGLSAGTTGNYLASSTNGAGIAGATTAAHDGTITPAFDYTATLAGNPTLAAGACQFSTTGLICEGATANLLETLITVTDPTVDRTVTFPDADSNTVIPDAGAANNFLTAISAGGVISKAQPAFSNLSGAATDAQVPNLNTLSTGLTVSRCVETDGTGLLAVAAGVCGTSAGDSISVNGVSATDADFDDATPAAPANAVNMKFQKDALTPNNVSAHLLLTDIDGAGLAVSGTELVTASSEQAFLAAGALTCGAATNGKMQVHTTPLQYCDNAATPALQYAAYGDSSGNALSGDTATAFFGAGTLEVARGGTGIGAFGTGVATGLGNATNGAGGFTTTDGTKTLTNTTLDTEGTGNVVTIPKRIWLPAAGCNNATAGPVWDLPTTSPAVAACITGTNTQKGVLDFADAVNLSAQLTYKLPSTWAGTVDANIKWLSATITGDVVWQLSTICVADAETDDPAFNTASTVTDTTKGTANQTNDASITTVTVTGCAAGELMHLKIQRDSAHASDTMAGAARLIGVELVVREAI